MVAPCQTGILHKGTELFLSEYYYTNFHPTLDCSSCLCTMPHKKQGDKDSTKSSTLSLRSLASKTGTALQKAKQKAIAVLSPPLQKPIHHPVQAKQARNHLFMTSVMNQAWNSPMMNFISGITNDGNPAKHIADQLSKDWKSPVYAFYHPVPKIMYVNNRCCHEFLCAAHGCKYKSWCYLDMKDKASTGNLIKHTKSCWGDEAWIAANECQNALEVREKVMSLIAKSGSITAVFNRVKVNRKITYSHMTLLNQHPCARFSKTPLSTSCVEPWTWRPYWHCVY